MPWKFWEVIFCLIWTGNEALTTKEALHKDVLNIIISSSSSSGTRTGSGSGSGRGSGSIKEIEIWKTKNWKTKIG